MSHSTEPAPTTPLVINLIRQASDQCTTSQLEPHNNLEAASNTPSDPPYRRRNAFSPGFNNPPPFKAFFLTNYPDIITQLLCLGAAFFLYTYCPPIMPRYFPVYIGVRQSEWGIRHGKPYITEYINTWVSAVSSFAVPALIMSAIGLWGTRSFEDGNASLTGLGYALSTSTLFQTLLKIFIGGLRPHFLAVCSPYIPTAENPTLLPPGVNGGMFYAASDICNGPANRLKEAQMSFPSGHACAAFAGFGYLTLWLNAHFKILSNGRRFREIFKDRDEEEGILTIGRRVSHWKLPMVMAPLCVAVLVAGSKVRDMWHHPIDVIVGALIGLAFAHVAYKMMYRSVYDWRDNHVPLGVGAKEEEEDEKERRKEV